jgi:hypothetical protein
MMDFGSTDFYRPVEIRKSNAWLFHAAMRSMALFFRKNTGRQFGIPRIVATVARWFPATNRLTVAGPDGQNFILRATENGFGVVTGGYGISEIRPLVARLPRDAVVIDIGANTGI